ncbi:MAG: hypothetical protein KGL39_04155 [Patescibacteria group bacterium]|nr:hypothetical protein [Patescibacteria group bacterium]
MLESLVGKKVYIRTITFHARGIVSKIEDGWVELTDAECIFDSGSFEAFLRGGKASSAQGIPGTYLVNLGAVTDILEIVE